MQTAATNGINRLYHYQPFDMMRLRPVVCEDTLYFSNPKDFNDPWDCQPWFRIGDLGNPAVVERHVSDYIRITRNHMPTLPDAEVLRRAQVLRTDKSFLRSKLEEHSASMGPAIDEQYRVYCLSTKSDCELMWAHYGDKHRGICLEFSTQNDLICASLPVSYRATYPDFQLTTENEDEILAPMLTKSAAWQYEDEYRLVAQDENYVGQHDVIVARDNMVRIPNGALTAIIVGCLTSTSDEKCLRKMLRESSHEIQIRRAVRARDQFKLNIVNV